MTENEAIKVLVTQKQCIDKSSSGQCKINCGDCKKNIPIAYQEKSYEVAITALKEIQLYKDGKLCLVPKDVYSKQCCELDAYKEIGTVEECRKAVEKQKAKKPDIYTDTRNMVDLHGNVYAEQANVYLCPTCESFIGYVGNNIFHYCPVCGQAIDENLEGMEDERD